MAANVTPTAMDVFSVKQAMALSFHNSQVCVVWGPPLLEPQFEHLKEMWVVVHTCDSNTQEVETRGSAAEGL